MRLPFLLQQIQVFVDSETIIILVLRGAIILFCAWLGPPIVDRSLQVPAPADRLAVIAYHVFSYEKGHGRLLLSSNLKHAQQPREQGVRILHDVLVILNQEFILEENVEFFLFQRL